ncbi:Major cardiolipin synthase ClsA [compost metagenome]
MEWPALSETMKNRLDLSPKGLENILYFANAKESSVREVRLLVDGPQSFVVRDSLMAEAKKSIDVMSWAIYSDKTGFEAADLLIKKHLQGVKVRVIVDGQVATRPGYTEAVQKLEQAGVQVIRWTSATHPFAGQHRKMLIVDGEHMVAGGLNFGDVYSHKNADPKVAKWRDTDIYVQGDAVKEGSHLFAEIWNEQVTEKNLSYEKMTLTTSAVEGRVRDSEKVLILEHDPRTDKEGSTIMMTLLKGLREAKSTVEIENAYIVLFPELKNEIAAAVARGVKVRIFTNSHLSVDEPIVSIPILRSARDLVGLGAEVYLRLGSTLHSKLVVIDGQYTMVMSYNLHPRSERVEGEMAVVVNSKTFAEGVRQTFDADIQPGKAFRINSPEEIQLPENPVALPTLRIFFDML